MKIARQWIARTLYELGIFWKLLAAIFIAYGILNSNVKISTVGFGILLVGIAEGQMREIFLAMGGRHYKDLGILLLFPGIKYPLLAGLIIITVGWIVVR